MRSVWTSERSGSTWPRMPVRLRRRRRVGSAPKDGRSTAGAGGGRLATADVRLRANVIHERLVADYAFDGHYQRVKLYVAEVPLEVEASFSRACWGANLLALRASRSRLSNTTSSALRERGSTPSTPAARAPLLLRTRLHPTTRNAGRVIDEIGKVIESTAGQPPSLAQLTEYPLLGLGESGHEAPVFTSDLLKRIDAANSLDPFAKWPASRPRTTRGPPPHPGNMDRRWAFPPTNWSLVGDGPPFVVSGTAAPYRPYLHDPRGKAQS